MTQDTPTFFELVPKRRLRMAVIGDAMIDSYRHGKVDRISPEFPVQVLHSADDCCQERPGGAANVCYQAAHFNTDCFLVAALDAYSRQLFADYPFDISYCVDLLEGQNPRKIRFYDNDFPLLRWDIEQPATSFATESLLENFAQLLQTGIDVVICSDYRKGLWDVAFTRQVIGLCQTHNVPVLVDPKGQPVSKWQGCTIFKPNRNEAASLTGTNNWRKQCDDLLDAIRCQSIVITQEGNGCVGKTGKEYFEYRPNGKLQPKEVNSVIGAGDCFIVVLATALAHGLDIAEGCRLAFEGGIEYVRKRHNRPITPYHIKRRLDSYAAKCLSVGELLYLKKHYYTEPTKWIFANGVFDILHPAHLKLLQFAKSKGDKLVVALNSDASTRRLKGPNRPVNKLADRMFLVAGIADVDFVVAFEEDDPYEVLKRLEVDCIVKGGDYAPEGVIGREFAKEVAIFSYVEGYSTSLIIRSCQS